MFLMNSLFDSNKKINNLLKVNLVEVFIVFFFSFYCCFLRFDYVELRILRIFI